MSYSNNLDNSYELINFNVRQVRRELEKKGVRKDDYHYNYRGLCDEASTLFLQKMKNSCERRCIPFKGTTVHGEQRHNPRIRSTQWYAQHTWACVEIRGVKWYVDCTSSQFQDMYDDIPDYYISRKEPKWFYNDRKNPAFNGITKWLNQHVIFTKTIVDSDGDIRKVHDGIIEILQYDVWGSISDFIRKIIGGKNNGKKQK
ncbi:MAG: hypothetical protein NC548_12940 [Lachnospiraceae bacterium]|nr:hypothetical protein [Lachnospiraceae bacterium]MCM1230703.1 hypothetical protein [Ruminococcus flavefaciens]